MYVFRTCSCTFLYVFLSQQLKRMSASGFHTIKQFPHLFRLWRNPLWDTACDVGRSGTAALIRGIGMSINHLHRSLFNIYAHAHFGKTWGGNEHKWATFWDTKFTFAIYYVPNDAKKSRRKARRCTSRAPLALVPLSCTRSAQEVHKKCTRSAQEVHKKCTRSAREGHERCTYEETLYCSFWHNWDAGTLAPNVHESGTGGAREGNKCESLNFPTAQKSGIFGC